MTLTQTMASYDQKLTEISRDLKGLNFDPEMGPAKLREIRLQLSDIFAELRPIVGWAKVQSERLTRLKRQYDKTLVVGIEKHLPADVKLTEKLRESHVAIHLEQNIVGNLEMPLPALIDSIELLLGRAESLRDIVEERRDSLITVVSTLKTEVGLG